MVAKTHFSGAVEGRVPTQFEEASGRVMGKDVDALMLAREIGRGVEAGTIAPVNILARSGAVHVTEVMPGGRKPEELAASQVEGKQPYRPRDIFSSGPN